MKPVEGILKAQGIFPVTDYESRELEQCLDPVDRDATLKHFSPRFPSAEPSLELASSMFASFVFRKSRDAPPPARLTPVVGATEGQQVLAGRLIVARMETEEGKGHKRRSAGTDEEKDPKQQRT